MKESEQMVEEIERKFSNGIPMNPTVGLARVEISGVAGTIPESLLSSVPGASASLIGAGLFAPRGPGLRFAPALCAEFLM